MAPLPLPNSYWVEPDRILAGEHPAGVTEEATLERLRRLLDAGVDCFIDLTDPIEFDSYQRLLAALPAKRDVVCLRKPIPDHGLPESAEKMQEILDALDGALADGRRVYLHCRAGIGRTNLVAGCWIASHGGGGQAALERLNRDWRGSARSHTWPSVPETDAQIGYVRSWKSPRSGRGAAAANIAVARELRNRVRGMLLGLATGESLGHALHGLPAGAWSDKTAMALCLAESFASQNGHVAADQVARYQAWQRMGHWSSTGACVGISAATSRALATAQWTGNPYAGSHDPAHADAEPLARIGPAVVWHLNDPRAAIDAAVNCARITHQAPLTLDAVRYLAALLTGALTGENKAALLAPNYSSVPGAWDAVPLRPPISDIAAGAWHDRKPRRMRRGRYAAATSLEAALSAFEGGDDLAQCLHAAASQPGDAQSAAAIVGQLAGAHYGASALPPTWRAGVARAADIEAMADSLLDAAVRAAGP